MTDDSIDASLDAEAPPMRGARRLALLGLGWLAVGLAAIGVVLPVLPTTPFLLVAAWAFAKASPAARHWLHGHRLFGPFIRDWQREGAIPRRGKIAAVVGMLMAWHVVFVTSPMPWVPVVVGLCLSAVAVYVVTRPAPRTEMRAEMRAAETD